MYKKQHVSGIAKLDIFMYLISFASYKNLVYFFMFIENVF